MVGVYHAAQPKFVNLTAPSIVMETMTMHGGNVRVDCSANGGTIFTLCFPPASSEMRRTNSEMLRTRTPS